MKHVIALLLFLPTMRIHQFFEFYDDTPVNSIDNCEEYWRIPFEIVPCDISLMNNDIVHCGHHTHRN
jgi:hypothetical protein